ncbi:hypothetical protein DPMN_175518 [Dreissena polymorpha]|uniref:Uncharacterized protein n=1 Tax=Dreissena polymorpha TaxID=45954 RepID=A0A9D4E5B2_DREPO|nr:hypothetical protein DPMN_175442 [Dreissena polymorpha]KAH3774144.1 hypothetical protein DPMN_175518 [Dreissena polymorpha]
MGWGDDWGNKGFTGSIAGGGRLESKPPAGTHVGNCMAGNPPLGSGGWGTPYYNDKCPGCRRDRSATRFPSGSGVGDVLKVGSLYKAAKSLWG